MKRISALVLVISLCLLFSVNNLSARQQESKPAKMKPDSKYSRISVCSKALEALGRIGDPRMKEVLIRGLKSKEFLIRASATKALCRLDDKETIPLLKNSLKDENCLVRILAAKALLIFGETGMEEKLLGFLNDNDPVVRAAAVEQLGQFKGKYMSKLAEILLKDSNYIVRLKAIQQLGINRFNPATPLIEQASKDPNPQIRQVACIALGQIGDQKTVRFVAERLKDTEAVVRSSAKEGMSLLRISKTEVVQIAKKAKKEDGLLKLLRQDLDNKDSTLRVSSFVALANLKDVTILPLLLREVILPENTTLVKKGAAKALCILKPSLSGLFDEATKSNIISSQNLELNYKAGGKSLLSIVISALENTNDPLHDDAVFILGELKDEASLPALRQALSQEDPDIVANVAYVLGQFQDKEAVTSLIKLCNSYGL